MYGLHNHNAIYLLNFFPFFYSYFFHSGVLAGFDHSLLRTRKASGSSLMTRYDAHTAETKTVYPLNRSAAFALRE